MSASTPDVAYDPYDVEINANPYPTFRRLRDEAPIFYNEQYRFWALSRHADVEAAFVDWQRLSSSRGDILELIQSEIELPSGTLIFEDPPAHTRHRQLLSRVFTPRRMAALEPKVRQYCAECLDPIIGSDRFDFVADLGAVVPMRTIGMLLGIPEQDQEFIRRRADASLRTEPGQQMADVSGAVDGEAFADYIDWRADHPSDDLMTALMTTEFEDDDGELRTLTRDEVLTYTHVVAGAGNETTNRLIGWFGKILGEDPDQRRELVADRSLIPNAVEETLRYEPIGPHVARYVSQDVEYHGTTVPAGSAMLLLVGSANRDERRYDNPDRFDIHRDLGQHLTFGYGLHFCLGAALARLEGRVALDEVLDRFPDWEVDLEQARLAPTSTVRGWETMPVAIR